MKQLVLVFLVVLSFFSSSAQKLISLHNCISLAKKNDPILVQQQYDVEHAKAKLIATKYRPNLKLSSEILFLNTRQYYPSYPLYSSAYNRQDWFQLTKEIQYNVRKNSVLLGNKVLQVAEEKYDDEVRQELYIVANKWVDAWYSKMKLTLSYDAVNSLGKLINTTTYQPDTDEFLRLKIFKEQYEMFEIDAENDYAVEMNELQYHLGIDSLRIEESETDFTDFNLGHLSVDTLLKIAQKNRSDFALLSLQLQANQINTRIQKTKAYPFIETGLLFNPQNKVNYYGVLIAFQIPAFNRNQYEIERTKIEYDELLFDLKCKSEKLRLDIEKNYRYFLTQSIKRQKMGVALENATKLLELVQRRHLEGKTNEVDLWEAQRAWFEIKKLFLETEYEYRKGYVKILYDTELISHY